MVAKISKAERAAQLRRQEAYIFEQEQKRMNRIMGTKPLSIFVQTSHAESGYNVDFTYNDMSPVEFKEVLLGLKSAGFFPRVFASKDGKGSNVGKVGEFKSATKVEGKNQWVYLFTVKGSGNGEQKVTGFSATSFRTGDKVRFVKNDAGFMDAVIISEEDYTAGNDIPF